MNSLALVAVNQSVSLHIECSNCRTGHLVYAGVNEVRNSVYFVTVQGIAEMIGDAQ